MTYYIKDESDLDSHGNIIPPGKFFVVNQRGDRIGPLTKKEADLKKQQLEEQSKSSPSSPEL